MMMTETQRGSGTRLIEPLMMISTVSEIDWQVSVHRRSFLTGQLLMQPSEALPRSPNRNGLLLPSPWGRVRLAVLSGMALAASGCAEIEAEEPAAMSTFTQADADRISDECGADRSWLKVLDDGALTFEPPSDGDYEVSTCILERIKNSGVTKFGFVGNEKYRAEDD
jgi:hypothetical protein